MKIAAFLKPTLNGQESYWWISCLYDLRKDAETNFCLENVVGRVLRSTGSCRRKFEHPSCFEPHNSHYKRGVFAFRCCNQFSCCFCNSTEHSSSYSFQCSSGELSMFRSLGWYGGAALLRCVPSLWKHLPPCSTLLVENRLLGEFLGVLRRLVPDAKCHHHWTVYRPALTPSLQGASDYTTRPHGGCDHLGDRYCPDLHGMDRSKQAPPKLPRSPPNLLSPGILFHSP